MRLGSLTQNICSLWMGRLSVLLSGHSGQKADTQLAPWWVGVGGADSFCLAQPEATGPAVSLAELTLPGRCRLSIPLSEAVSTASLISGKAEPCLE